MRLRAPKPSAGQNLSTPSHVTQGDPAEGPFALPVETAGVETSSPVAIDAGELANLARTGRPPEVVPNELEARSLLSTYLKTNRDSKRGSMTLAARLFAHTDKCSPELREAILREQGQARSSKHQLPVTVKRAMQASPALITHSRNPRDADVMFGHARGVMRRHWSEQRRLYAGEVQSSDDGTINFVVCVPWPWGGCRTSDKFGVKVGRFQWLPTCDHACDFIPGFTFAIRPTGAYRAADVCAAMGRLWRDTVKPDWAVLERGIWESNRVSALMQSAGVGISRSYAPRQKLIEGVFNRLWSVLSVMPGQVGRYRGEMERENKLLAAAQAGTLDPRGHFVDLTVAMAALEEAVRFHNRTPIESRHYGKWIPETRWREDLIAHPRASLDAALAYRLPSRAHAAPCRDRARRRPHGARVRRSRCADRAVHPWRMGQAPRTRVEDPRMSASKKPTEKELLPFQQENVATNQQNVPLPYVRGTRLVAGRWITPALDKITHNVPGQGKKG